jgi:hypothetical protein
MNGTNSMTPKQPGNLREQYFPLPDVLQREALDRN